MSFMSKLENVTRDDGCHLCVHLGPPNGEKAWCRKRECLIYINDRGTFRYVKTNGEVEKHGYVSTCEQWVHK